MRYIKKFDSIDEGIFSYFNKENKEIRIKKKEIIDSFRKLANDYQLRIINYYGEERGNTRIRTNYGDMYIDINDDFTVDIKGNVEMNSASELPFKFRNVSGNFKLRNSYNVNEFLHNFPDKVEGKFSVVDCGLDSLKNLPTKYVGKKFNCSSNNLQSLEGLPDYIGGNPQADIDVTGNDIYTLEYLENYAGDIALYLNPIDYIKLHHGKNSISLLNLLVNTRASRNNPDGLKDTYTNLDVFKSCDPIHPPKDLRSKPILYANRMLAFAEEIGLEFDVTAALKAQYDVR
jgi:hypothetical protein